MEVRNIEENDESSETIEDFSRAMTIFGEKFGISLDDINELLLVNNEIMENE